MMPGEVAGGTPIVASVLWWRGDYENRHCFPYLNLPTVMVVLVGERGELLLLA